MDRRRLKKKKYLKIRTAAEVYDLNPRTLRLWCLRGEIEGATKVGKHWLIPVETLERIFEMGIPEWHRRLRKVRSMVYRRHSTVQV